MMIFLKITLNFYLFSMTLLFVNKKEESPSNEVRIRLSFQLNVKLCASTFIIPNK